MDRPTCPSFVALVLGLMAAACAHAARPMQTEDAGVLERGACEVETGAARLAADGTAAREAVLQFGCGIVGSTQLAWAAAERHDGDAPTRGQRFSGKTGLWQSDDEDGRGLAIAYAWSETEMPGRRWVHTATEVRLAYSHPAGSSTWHANLGHAHDGLSGVAGTTWSLAWEHTTSAATTSAVELFGDDRAAPWWNLGLRFTAVPRKVFLDASFGRQLARGRATLVGFGLKSAF